MPLLGDAVDLPRLSEVNIDAAIVAAACLSTMFAALFVSALPALRSGTASVASVLTSAGRSMTASRERHRARQVLVASQVALALILLVGSGLMARSVWRLRSVQPGFNPANAISFRMALPSATYPGAAESVRFFNRAVDGLAAIPGVQATGAVSKLPLDEQGRTDSAVFVEDRPIPPGSLPGIHLVSYATPGYFAAAGIPFIAGRSFQRVDPPHMALEAIVSRAFAERYWSGESAIGKRVRIFLRGPWYTVVGVVGSVNGTALDQPADQMVYCPLLPPKEDPRWAPRDLAVVIRTAGAAVSGMTGVAGTTGTGGMYVGTKTPGMAQSGDITVDPTKTHQVVDGFGLADVWQNSSSTTMQTLLWDPVNGIGLTLLRVGIDGTDDLLTFAQQSRALGYEGVMCIHPSQVDFVAKDVLGGLGQGLLGASNLVAHLSNALEYARRVTAHGALNPAIIWVNRAGRVKVSGLGLASGIPGLARHGTPQGWTDTLYVAPEVLAGGQATAASDVRSAAVTVPR
jgi:hypothetical protein